MDELPDLVIAQHCDKDVRDAALRFKETIAQSECRYSTNSKRFSIWSLVFEHLDRPVAAFLQAWNPSHPALPRLPGVFLPKGFSGSLKESIFETQDRIAFVVRLVGRFPSYPGPAEGIFCDTMETLFSIADFCGAQRPKQVADPRDIGKRGAPRRIKLARGTKRHRGKHYPLMHYPFCELCWRLCEHAENPTVVPRHGHSRYCFHHSEKSIATRGGGDYRTDHNHREQFHRELYYYFQASRESQLIRLGVPVKMAPEIARELAYKLVKAKLSPRHEAIHRMHWARARQVEIAKELGISRQAVSAVLKSPETIVEQIRGLATSPIIEPTLLQAAMNDPVARHCISAN